MVKQGPFIIHFFKKKNIFKLYSKLNLLGIIQIELTLLFKEFFDNNESTIKLIFQAFEFLLLLKFNSKIMFGSYYNLLLRNKHLRDSDLKYLNENIIKCPEFKKTKKYN